MSIKLKGSTDGSVSLDAPADTSPTGTDVSLTLPTSAGSANQFIKNGSTAGELEHSSMVETSTGVGIGTTSPYDSLTIRGTNEQLVFDLNSTNTGDYASIAWNGSNSDLGSGNYSCEIRGHREASGAHGKLSFLTRDSTNAPVERMYIESNGNVYINDSSSTGNSQTVFTALGYAEFNRTDDTGYGYVRLNVSTKAMNVSDGTTTNLTLSYNGNVDSNGTKNFRIAHPLSSKTDTHNLVHCAIESTDAGTVYPGMVDLVDGRAVVNIDTAHRMTEGTFEALNTVQSWTCANETGYSPVKCSLSGNLLTIECQDATSTDTVYYEVRGIRKDQSIMTNDATDENGRLIIEPLKPVEEELL